MYKCIIIILVITLISCNKPYEKKKTETSNTTSSTDKIPEVGEEITIASGLKYIDEVIGTGSVPKAGDKVKVHYTGFLQTGTKFDSSHDRGKPFEFSLGQGKVIKGWDEGIAQMSKGSKCTLIIPPDLGYGERGAGGSIPPNATLLFEVELIEFQ